MEVFKTGGSCLFMGDFVDCGFNSVEIFLLLLALTILFPAFRTLIRGNHQSRQIAKAYGIYDEYMRKYVSKNI